MDTQQVTVVALSNNRLMLAGAELTLTECQKLVGRTVPIPTNSANEVADYKIEQVSQNRETGDINAWVVRGGYGHHARIVAKC